MPRKDKRLYSIWINMRQRVFNTRCPDYPNYGGRGIGICGEWGDFAEFERWAQKAGYADDLTIERIDNDSDYRPENCRWATKAEQVRNTRKNSRDSDGTLLADIAKQTGIAFGTLWYRWNKGLRGSDLRAPLRQAKDSDGTPLTTISEQTGIPIKILRKRHWRGDRGARLRRKPRQRSA